MKRTIVLTTPTSATTTLWRMICQMLPENEKRGWFIDDCLSRGIEFDDIRFENLPSEGCYLINQPHLLNLDQDFSDTRFIVNFRDPRDMSCNQYYWVFVHPKPGMSDSELARRREAVSAAGIDVYVEALDHRPLFKTHQWLANRPELLNNSVVTSYAQLCLDTSNVVEKLASFLDFKDAEAIEVMKKQEHPSALVDTDKWIGGKWKGADVFPGRARVELRAETFNKLSERYVDVLETLSALDIEEFRYFYGANSR